MKIKAGALALIFTLLIAPVTPAHAVTNLVTKCGGITVDPSVKKGVLLNCLNGKDKVYFEAIRGPVIVNVWGSWCEPCREEIPLLVKLAKTKKVAMIGIDVVEDSDATGRKFAAANKMTWPMLSDIKSKTKVIFGFGVPVTRFIDANGKGVYEKVGPFKSYQEIQNLLRDFLRIKV
jgi:thiol-disulfide isomerase/thioredoxin